MLAAIDSETFGTLSALVLFIAASGWIGVLANRAMQEGSFLKGFFLGNRGLGAWALALTATVQSGGTFMGFPSLVYTHGWAVALWIAGYMVVPITGFGVLAKRLAQISRRCGAITIPDLFRLRFGSPAVGVVASLFILFYMSFMMVAQFKAGALVMKIAWVGSGQFSEDQNIGRFAISNASLETLRNEDVPGNILERLERLSGKTFASDAKLIEELNTALGSADANKFGKTILAASELTDWPYIVGLAIFTITVVGYTMAGGFLAAVWTDLFQSVMMLIGVVILLLLTFSAVADRMREHPEEVAALVPGQASAAQSMPALEFATRKAVANPKIGAGYAFAPGYDPTVPPQSTKVKAEAGASNAPAAPAPSRLFLPPGLAISFFFIWVFAGLGSPAGIVRLMASSSTGTIRRSIYLLGVYNLFIYIPLIMICICGRALDYDLPAGKTDEIIPRMALGMTSHLPLGSFLAGLILAAPFGAVMATVSSYLVVIASGLVRDVYQRFINPDATQYELKRLSYVVMILVGAMAVGTNIRPVAYLQAIVVFSGTGAACTFCVPVMMLAYWRRATVPGTIAAMFAGAGTVLGLYLIGFLGLDDPQKYADGVVPWVFSHGSPVIGAVTSFRPYFLLQLDPIIWGLSSSLVVGIVVSHLTSGVSPSVVSHFFDAAPSAIDSSSSK